MLEAIFSFFAFIWAIVWLTKGTIFLLVPPCIFGMIFIGLFVKRQLTK